MCLQERRAHVQRSATLHSADTVKIYVLNVYVHWQGIGGARGLAVCEQYRKAQQCNKIMDDVIMCYG